ncbi:MULTISPECIES: ArsR/SmtB family transcription factor [Mycobacteriaceae]|uniref:ArsR/SmtB family transcription factor n=1 Tax=Mycobacteriaceae TaxID=1762 RepID=UPI0008366D4F|nr:MULTISPECIES: metalloregulator ArsR/SmtB family transcription factor [Mycobacteriaceae]MDV3134409.1 metalloregulator ArsR/SmtB family transcription factor [Mycobacterium sp. 29Ha]
MHSSFAGFSMPTQEQVTRAAETFRMLSDPTRVKVLWALLQGETSVACLADLADAAPTVVSQHLAKLRLAGLVKSRRDGTFVYYSPADTDVLRVLSQALFGADTITADPTTAEPVSRRRPSSRR